ncbi:uncharacterized protein IUM83_00201 [Phytophthora cinnamomi]|uniref:uncharacterized protein n=1 Tax=Phytophthora cinnamomi TaxID=4785 RepID=UPI00355A3551|nr:hypothetical protein IUM83_00201 [Phytophthora cinnamomi]
MAAKRPASSSGAGSPVRPPPSSCKSLPLSLFSLVLEFAMFYFTQELGPARRSLHAKDLKDVALVARGWYQAVDELAARFRRDTMQLTLKFGSRAEVLAIRRQVQLRGRSVRDLRVRMGRSDGARFVTGVWWWMEDREVPWDVLFAQMPALKRLDLRQMPLESRHVPLLLQTAARHCLQLEMLVLPRKQDMAAMVDCAAARRVMEVLREALERTLEFEEPIDATKQHIFCSHPHGLLSTHHGLLMSGQTVPPFYETAPLVAEKVLRDGKSLVILTCSRIPAYCFHSAK